MSKRKRASPECGPIVTEARSSRLIFPQQRCPCRCLEAYPLSTEVESYLCACPSLRKHQMALSVVLGKSMDGLTSSTTVTKGLCIPAGITSNC